MPLGQPRGFAETLLSLGLVPYFGNEWGHLYTHTFDSMYIWRPWGVNVPPSGVPELTSYFSQPVSWCIMSPSRAGLALGRVSGHILLFLLSTSWFFSTLTIISFLLLSAPSTWSQRQPLANACLCLLTVPLTGTLFPLTFATMFSATFDTGTFISLLPSPRSTSTTTLAHRRHNVTRHSTLRNLFAIPARSSTNHMCLSLCLALVLLNYFIDFQESVASVFTIFLVVMPDSIYHLVTRPDFVCLDPQHRYGFMDPVLII